MARPLPARAGKRLVRLCARTILKFFAATRSDVDHRAAVSEKNRLFQQNHPYPCHSSRSEESAVKKLRLKGSYRFPTATGWMSVTSTQFVG